MNPQKGNRMGDNAVNEDLEKILSTLSDAGCGSGELANAKQLCEAGDAESLIRYFRKCRSKRMAELHEVQRKVDRLDFLIRQMMKAIQ